MSEHKVTAAHLRRAAVVYVFSELRGLPNYVVYQCISGGL